MRGRATPLAHVRPQGGPSLRTHLSRLLAGVILLLFAATAFAQTRETELFRLGQAEFSRVTDDPA